MTTSGPTALNEPGQSFNFGVLIRTPPPAGAEVDITRVHDTTESYLCNVENGHKSVSIERAEAWARLLGYPEAGFVQLALRDQFERAGLEGYDVTVRRAS